MIVVIVSIAFLHSHVTVNHMLKSPSFSTGDQCMAYINSRIEHAQRMANKTFQEKTEVRLRCDDKFLRDA